MYHSLIDKYLRMPCVKNIVNDCMQVIVQYKVQWHYIITLSNSHLPLPTGTSLKHISSQCW